MFTSRRVLVLIAFFFVSVWCRAPDLRQMDLIEALQLSNTSYAGLSVTTGTNSMHQALELSGGTRAVYLPSRQRDRVLSLLAGAREFTLLATLRHSRFNAATLLAITSGGQRLMELQSSGRAGEVRFHYARSRSDDRSRSEGRFNDVVVESFRERLADGLWHRLAVSVSGSRLSLYVDCRLVETRAILPLATNMSSLVGSGKPLLIWIGQRNTKHFIMQGSLQDMKLVRGAGGQQLQCPQHPAACPTCGQHEQLQDTVASLEGVVQRLAHRLKVTEEALKQLQLCDCRRSCQVNNTVYEENSHWDTECHTCVCRNGKTLCQPKPCPKLNCSHPHYEPGLCCPACKADCYDYSSVRYSHGESVAFGDCTSCVCRNGMLDCQSTVRSTHCPLLDCPKHQHISVDGQCCQFCPGDDFCRDFHVKCHANASCINRREGYACQCNPGYSGNGTHCQDIDECAIVNGSFTNVCGENSECINTAGGYRCQCPVGYKHTKEHGCVDKDECETDRHGCHSNATCHNKDGSYSCICLTGFTGDGTHCEPVCSEPCENGGICIATDDCLCRPGFAGAACEHDIDECSGGAHRCQAGSGSVCVNLPGWYRCDCAPGYRSLVFDDITGHSCTDIDECTEGSDTCHPNAACVNTLGGFLCVCYSGENCTQDCYLPDGSVQLSGSTWRQKHEPCRECYCADGVVTCTTLVTCDCQSAVVDPNCCSQCFDTVNRRRGCYHQERTNVLFQPGDRWLYQCQECECLYGEIDCWPITCPPTNCPFPQRQTTDCCARCSDDPCAVTNGTTSARPQPCHVIPPGHSDRLRLSTDPPPQQDSLQARCDACDCQVPFCDRLITAFSSQAYRKTVSNSLVFLTTLTIFLQYLTTRIYTGLTDLFNAKSAKREKTKFNESTMKQLSCSPTRTKIKPRLENG